MLKTWPWGRRLQQVGRVCQCAQTDSGPWKIWKNSSHGLFSLLFQVCSAITVRFYDTYSVNSIVFSSFLIPQSCKIAESSHIVIRHPIESRYSAISPKLSLIAYFTKKKHACLRSRYLGALRTHKKRTMQTFVEQTVSHTH